jgi:glucosylceramidase
MKMIHMKRTAIIFLTVTLITAIMQSCRQDSALLNTKRILLTSESGDKISERENVRFARGTANGTVIVIEPEQIKQTIDGIGSSFTESSAFVLAHLDPVRRAEVMKALFGEEGANFSLARTHIGACDFSVEGKYSYADKKGDTALGSFSLEHDLAGFSPAKYPGIVDEGYDLLPMIREALQIKNGQKDSTLRIVASAWTAPSWMKDIEDWYIPGNPENNYQGTGGSLKKGYEETYARYLLKYLDACREKGIEIWGITPVNEPHGNNGQWESMHFTPETQNEFIKKYLGPGLKNSDHSQVKLLIYDQNRDGLEHWTDVILGDPETAAYVYGTAVHWYESTFKVYEDVFERVNAKFPDHAILHTEGCIDDLGKPAPAGITDPGRFTEENWFNNDSFWWNPNATDWGYTAPWPGVISEDHPIYTPVHRYARNIIVSIDHWLRGWIDWNAVLDHNGGPNHVGNYCGAPVMINTETRDVYYTPVYYILAQLSKTIRPGDHAVATKKNAEGLDPDALHACATLNDKNLLTVQVLNTTKGEIRLSLQVRGQYAEINSEANSLKTIQIQL